MIPLRRRIRIFPKMAGFSSSAFHSFALLTLYFFLTDLDLGLGVSGALTSPSRSGTSTNTGYSSNFRGPTSGFRGLDKVLNRLDAGQHFRPDSHHPFSSVGDNSARGRPSLVTTTLRPLPHFGGPSGSQVDKEFDEDDDAELDDEDSSYEDEDDGPGGNHNDVQDKMSQWGYAYRNRILASRTTPSTTTSTTTTSTTTTTPAPPPQQSYSQHKWNTYGTRAGVEAARRQSYQTHGGFNTGGYSSPVNGRHSSHHSTNTGRGGQWGYGGTTGGRIHAQPQTPDTAIKQAVQHALKVQTEGACKIPRPKLIRVQEFYPHPGKTYLPHCTILHQCSDDTGCCKNDLTCSPKNTQRVELSFYTITVESNRGSTVERLIFYNHTECECRDRLDEQMPRDFSSSDAYSKSWLSNHLDPLDPAALGGVDGGTGHSSVKKRNLMRCKCPSAFTQRISDDGDSCTCDCFDKELDCLKQKRGRDFFSMQDKWCIQSGRCEIPGCSYGSYIHLAGRCPRKMEKYSLSWHRYLAE